MSWRALWGGGPRPGLAHPQSAGHRPLAVDHACHATVGLAPAGGQIYPVQAISSSIRPLVGSEPRAKTSEWTSGRGQEGAPRACTQVDRAPTLPPMALTCPDCGSDVADGAKFCPECGARQPERPVASREVRKLVTVLFADVTGSTALGEQLDPEALRGLMNRYFARMRSIIETHGGTVEKFIGDAVMAVFGIPQVHEDDALRAVRAAAEIRDALAAMNTELEAERGIAIRFRTGVNTGEVVAGDPEGGTTLVTGDTVNTAARLEQAAPPGEILLGQADLLARPRTRSTRSPWTRSSAKGKAQAVEAYRLVAVRAGEAGRARHLDAPMVGRDRELATAHRRLAPRGRRAHPAPRHPRRPGWGRQEPPRARVHRARPRQTVAGRSSDGASATARASPTGRSASSSTKRPGSRNTTTWPGPVSVSTPWRRASATRGSFRPRWRPSSACRATPHPRRSCSGRSDGSWSISPPSIRPWWSSRISTGPRTRCSTWSTTSSTSLVVSRCSCSRPHGPS